MPRTKEVQNLSKQDAIAILKKIVDEGRRECNECGSLGMEVANILRDHNLISQSQYKDLCEE